MKLKSQISTVLIAWEFASIFQTEICQGDNYITLNKGSKALHAGLVGGGGREVTACTFEEERFSVALQGLILSSSSLPKLQTDLHFLEGRWSPSLTLQNPLLVH